MSLKIISYNVNGIRAAIRKGFIDWLEYENPDVLMLQETKAQPEQIDTHLFKKLGYNCYLHSADKKGYSGVAILSKDVPDFIKAGMGIDRYDSEGRLLRADFGDLTLLSTYFPSGTMGALRQGFKMEFLSDFSKYILDLKTSRDKLVLSGDYNICHKAIDIHNPVANKNSSGFLPEERDWVCGFLDLGFVDSFRLFHKEPDRYTWWSYRAGARKRNLGWRIDYHIVSESLKPHIQNADILDSVLHSDHCPVLLVLN